MVINIADDLRPLPPNFGEPIEVITGFHRFLRATLVWKCSGLTEDQLRWSPVPSGTSLLAILKHSIRAERWWIWRVLGNGDALGDAIEADDVNGWTLPEADTFASIVAAFEEEATRSEAVVAGLAWNAPTARRLEGREDMTVAWVITHMIEEVARHRGQVDIIRELIDGHTGE